MHKFPHLYAQLESTVGFEELAEKPSLDYFLHCLDKCCEKGFIYISPKICFTDELLDFLDGNGFQVDPCADGTCKFMPLKRR